MKIVADAEQRAKVARVLGILLLIAAPGLAFGTYYSTQQPIEILALAERMKATLPPDDYSSAVYHGSHAQATLDNKWNPGGFATLGAAGFLIGAGLFTVGTRRRQSTG